VTVTICTFSGFRIVLFVLNKPKESNNDPFFGDFIIKILKNGTYQINNQNRTQHQYYYNGGLHR
jgi:hypothetical protein